MTWSQVILMQIVASVAMALYSRRLALAERNLFFVIGILSYSVIATTGFVYSISFGGGLPDFPQANAWPYLVAEGIFIPISWLLQYKIISKLGASNAVLITMLNIIATAILGFLLLGDKLSLAFVLGAILILGSVYVVFQIHPDSKHRNEVTLRSKVLLVSCMVVFFSAGLFAEKQAINIIGVWNYAAYGWGLQLAGAILIFLLYGRKELPHLNWHNTRQGLTLGLITSIAGLLFIYALSKGTLSETIIAVSGKIALTMVFASVFLHERNSPIKRLLAFALAMAGLLLLFA